MIRTAIVGATGYTGLELVKILSSHPQVKLTSLTAKLDKPRVYIDEEFSVLKGKVHLLCTNFSSQKLPKNIDVVFLAVPHTVSLGLAPKFIKKGIKVIDLSADFRLEDPLLYQKWYKAPHTQPKLLKEAVYGLPELYKGKIKKACLIANPGCYPTGIILGIAPILKNIAQAPIHINAVTGSSGAGRKASLPLLLSECINNIRPYKVLNHQHQPEIEQELSKTRGKSVQISFVPNLGPLERGILTTIFMELKDSAATNKIINIYKRFYKKAPFVEVLQEGDYPELKNVLHTNYCHIGIKAARKELIVITVIDNLGKGAAGQAVQNMNLMFDLPEETGLK